MAILLLNAQQCFLNALCIIMLISVTVLPEKKGVFRSTKKCRAIPCIVYCSPHIPMMLHDGLTLYGLMNIRRALPLPFLSLWYALPWLIPSFPSGFYSSHFLMEGFLDDFIWNLSSLILEGPASILFLLSIITISRTVYLHVCLV